MSKAELSKGPRSMGPVISTAEMLHGAPLPADYLNQFSSEVPIAEIGLRGTSALRANEHIIPITHPLQVFALNCIAIGAERFVSTDHMVNIGKGAQQESTRNRLTRYFRPFAEQLNKAVGEELIVMRKTKITRGYTLQPAHFVQDEEPQNKLFERLTDIGRKKFGMRVLGIIQGEIERLEMPATPQAPEPVIGDPKDDLGWRLQSACRDEDPELFFRQGRESSKAAKRICRDCSVRGECLAYALSNKAISYGIWGGLSPRQRTTLKRN